MAACDSQSSTRQFTDLQIYNRAVVCCKHFRSKDFSIGRPEKLVATTTLKLSTDIQEDLYTNPQPSTSGTRVLRVAPIGAIDVDSSDDDLSITLEFKTPKKEVPFYEELYKSSPRKRVTPLKRREEKLDLHDSARCYAVPGADNQEARGLSTILEELDTAVPLVPEVNVAAGAPVGRETGTILRRLGFRSSTSLTSDAKMLYAEAQRLQHRVRRSYRDLHSVKKAAAIARDEKFRDLIERMTSTQRRFFQNQVRNVQREPKGRSFTDDEKADALAIWKSGPRTYKLLSKMFTMPSISTLKVTLRYYHEPKGH